MQIRVGAVALLVAVFGTGVVPVAGWTAENEGAAVAAEPASDAQKRVRERRRERHGQRKWISVPELSLTEALPLVGARGVVIIDVTCREGGANIADMIPGAVWQDCTTVEEWAHRYAEAKTILVYCA